MGWLLRIDVAEDGTIEFRLRAFGVVLLALAPVAERSQADRFLFRVSGGLLAVPGQSGTFEVREVGGDGTLLTIVRDFEPRLPWWIYRSSQALVHEWIMRAFGRALAMAD